MQKQTTDELDLLLDKLPPHIALPLRQKGDRNQLLEVVMDLGRHPEARYPDNEIVLSQEEVTQADIEYVSSRISPFDADNRAGIERTLHRISAVRNRKGRIVGLTCRVGRAVFGTIRIIEDLIGTGKSILLLGRPGVGKTTMLREVARVLADDFKKRVIIVDTSNEIAGDGDIPHPGIGQARRMQVPSPSLQHNVMIEAVENHMPEVIVIDEIGTELEAMAARTIAERGVQLVATAHGNTLENLLMNPTLSDLVGGIQTVTLGDEEARRRGTRKTILERKAPPTFDILVEIQRWDKVAIHSNVAEVVDSILRGRHVEPEVRSIDERGELRVQKMESTLLPSQKREVAAEEARDTEAARIFLFGISRDKLQQAAREVRMPVTIVDDLAQVDALITAKSYYRRRPQVLRDAEARRIPVYVVKSNTVIQVARSLEDIRWMRAPKNTVDVAMEETEEAIERVLGGAETVELRPQSAYIRRLQHRLAEKYNLQSQSSGEEPCRRVMILRRLSDLK